MGLDICDGVPLAPLVTLELGGPARHFVEVTDESTLADALAWADGRGLPVLVLGGGSNLVIGDAGFDGLVIRMAMRGRRFDAASSGEVLLTAAAGEPWDDLVAESVARGLAGVECLSGIPGLAGATPIQNVGAYGQEVSETIRSVRVLERSSLRTFDLAATECAFGYRQSAFKRDPDRFVVVAVSFALRKDAAPTLRYRELADAVAPVARPTLAQTRAAVMALRRRKSMLLDPADSNRRSVGSFFTNPIVSEEMAREAADRAKAAGAIGSRGEMPRWPGPDGTVKLSAGWLIERAGFMKGLRRGAVGISSAHALALVHHGGGTTAALLALARQIRDGVRSRFGVTLTPEPTIVGAGALG